METSTEKRVDMRRSRHIVEFIGVACISCFVSCQQPPPSDRVNLDLETNTLEYAGESYALGLIGQSRLDDLKQSVNEAFTQPAAITFEWHGTNLYLSPPSLPYPSGQTAITAYIDYARINRDPAYTFGIFFITGPVPQQGACDPKVLGVAINSPAGIAPPNEISNADNRYHATWIFVQDLENWTSFCTTKDRQNYLTHVVTHEMGHERAGLTHTDAFLGSYHTGQGNIPTPPRWDVMYSDFSQSFFQTELDNRIPIFDQVPGGPFLGHLTCQDNLAINRMTPVQ